MGHRVCVRPLSEREQTRLTEGLHASDAFEARRSQILLSSARGQSATQIAAQIGYSHEAVRLIIRAFNAAGLTMLQAGSRRPHRSRTAFEAAGLEHLRALLHQSPRTYGKPSSLWTLDMAAAVCVEQGVIAHPVSREAIRSALARLGIRWQRATHWIHSPDPAYARKKSAVTS